MIGFLIHHQEDTVGVAVVDLKAGSSVTGRYLDSGAEVTLEARVDVPLGHKIALADAAVDDTAVKYGHDVGRIVVDVRAGEHVHVHNLRTKRW